MNNERTKDEQKTNKRRCEPHGQINKRRRKYPLPIPLPRRGSVVTEKVRRTMNEEKTNKERTKNEQRTNKERINNDDKVELKRG